MAPFTNLGMNSATSKDWVEVTKHLSISELIPRSLSPEASHDVAQKIEFAKENPEDVQNSARKQAASDTSRLSR